MSEHDENIRLELFKLRAELADRTSARRLAVNEFFVTVNGAFAGVSGAIAASGWKEAALGWVFASSFAAILSSALWFLLILGYRNLNAAKYDVLTCLEKPWTNQLFTPEWKKLQESKYRRLTSVERALPIIFMLLHIAVAVACGIKLYTS